MTERSQFSEGTSLLLQLGWEKTGEGAKGETWSKGTSQTQLAFHTIGAEWWRFLAGLAHAEGTTPALLDADLKLPKLPRKPRASNRTELDLHLTGPTIRKNEGSAQELGQFVTSVAIAIKEIVKSDLGLKKLENRLVVKGLQPGCLRVRFLEPVDLAEGGLPIDLPAGSPEGGAMWRLGQVFNLAEKAAKHPTDSPELTAATSMTASARKAVFRLSSLLESAHWTTQGYMRGPQSSQPEPVTLSLSGAYRLTASTRDSLISSREISLIGTVDGWQWSDGVMRFVSGETSVRAAVPIGLHRDVAELIQDPSRPTVARFSVTERQTPQGHVVSKSYVLLRISGTEPLDDGTRENTT